MRGKSGEITNEESLYVVEYACTEDSRCQGFGCAKNKIELNGLRLGRLSKSNQGSKKFKTPDKMIAKWFHAKCMFSDLEKARPSSHILLAPNDFRTGWEELRDEDQSLLLQLMKELEEKRENSKNKKEEKKRKKKGSKDEESEDEDEKPKTKKSRTKKVVAPAALVQAAFSENVWLSVAQFLPMKPLLNLALVSHICNKVSREILCKHKGLTAGGYGSYEENQFIPPASLAPQVHKIKVIGISRISFLANYTNLTSLDFIHGSASSVFDPTLSQLSKLTYLKLEGTNVSTGDTSLNETLAKLTNLSSLHVISSEALVYYKTPAPYLEHFANLTNLTSLSITGISRNEMIPAIQSYSQLQNLTYLDMSFTNLGSDWIPVFAQMKALKSLCVTVKKDNNGKFNFSPLLNIEHFTIKRCRWENIVLPPNILSLHYEIDEGKIVMPKMPTTLRDVYMKYHSFTENDFPNLFSLFPTQCRIHLNHVLERYPTFSNYLEQIYALTLTANEYAWPKNNSQINILNSVATKLKENGLNPRQITLDLNVRHCTYKKKVYDAVSRIIAPKDTVLIVNYPLY